MNNSGICFREIMHAMWKPQKFKYIYLLATLYVFTLTIPSAAAVYWAFGDRLLDHSNAFSLLPRTRWRDAAVILMLIHQVFNSLKAGILYSLCLFTFQCFYCLRYAKVTFQKIVNPIWIVLISLFIFRKTFIF